MHSALASNLVLACGGGQGMGDALVILFVGGLLIVVLLLVVVVRMLNWLFETPEQGRSPEKVSRVSSEDPPPDCEPFEPSESI